MSQIKEKTYEVYMMPGMAANPLIFERIILPKNFKINYLEWLMPSENEEFDKYISRLSKLIIGKNIVLIGNSLGGHVGLIFSKLYPKLVKGIVLTGSSGLYENSMGDSYPKREDYNFIKKKTQEVFYSPEIATKEIVDEIFETVNDRKKLIKILAMAKSAIRHNMSSDLPKIINETAIIWGKNDTVTPPDVGVEFNNLMPNSELFWIDKCGHAPMMEHPHKFNKILIDWLKSKNI